RTVAVGDLNHDGKLDVVTANSSSAEISVLLGNGNGTFQAAQTYSAGDSPQSVAISDLDGDGKADLAVVSIRNPNCQVDVFLGKGDGTFQAARKNTSYGGMGYCLSIVTGDLDRDGKDDLAVGISMSPQGAGVLLGKADWTSQAVQLYATGN